MLNTIRWLWSRAHHALPGGGGIGPLTRGAKSRKKSPYAQPRGDEDKYDTRVSGRRAHAPKVLRIVVTGGPCAGKTSLVQRLLREGLPGAGHFVVVPELATLAIENGLQFGTISSPEQERSLHGRFLAALLALENLMHEHIKINASDNAVLVCDRGALDASAYCTTGVWQHVLADHGTTEADLCEKRYDCVLFMRSAAVGKSAAYSTDSNSARHESSAEAATIDERLLQIWSRHPHVIVITNDYDSFEDKLDASMTQLGALL